MKKIVLKIILLSLVIIFDIGCTDFEKKLLGHWTVSEASIDNISVLDSKIIFGNSLYFGLKRECALPNPFDEYFPTNKWESLKNEGIVKIKFSNASSFFNDTFRVSVINNDKVVLYNSHKHLTITR